MMVDREPLTYVCQRAPEGERPPTRTAFVGVCGRCGCRVWMTRLGLRAAGGVAAPVVCLECYGAESDGGVEVVEAAIREFREREGRCERARH